MGEATVKTVLSSPSSFVFRTKSEIPAFMSIIPIIPIAQKDKNILQMVLKIGGSASLLPEKYSNISNNLFPKNCLQVVIPFASKCLLFML